jgi:hypothetical protein
MLEIANAMQAPLFTLRLDSGGVLFGVRNVAGFVFGALCAGGDVVTVAPIWYWHEARAHYRPLMRNRRRW